MKYQLTAPRKGYEKNFEVAQELMTSFEYSGVFSETLLDKVFRILLQCVEVVSYDDSKDKNCFNITNELTHEIRRGTKQESLMAKYNQFEKIFNCYSIFSQEFKGYCTGMFLTLIRTDLK